MGYSCRGEIEDFWPDNTETELYIANCGMTLLYIIDAAKEHFGTDIDLDSLEIEAKKIHTSCITYDLYDPSDYTDFIVITKIPNLKGVHKCNKL